MLTCTKCNATNDDGSKFCKECGASIIASTTEENANTVLINSAEYVIGKTRFMHDLVSTITFNGTKVSVVQKNKMLFFSSTSGIANFDIMDIESVYIKKSYSTMYVIIFALAAFNFFMVPNWVLLGVTCFFGYMMRQAAIVIKYKGGDLTLFAEKQELVGVEKRDNPQLVLDYIKQYNPECVHVLMD